MNRIGIRLVSIEVAVCRVVSPANSVPGTLPRLKDFFILIC